MKRVVKRSKCVVNRPIHVPDAKNKNHHVVSSQVGTMKFDRNVIEIRFLITTSSTHRQTWYELVIKNRISIKFYGTELAADETCRPIYVPDANNKNQLPGRYILVSSVKSAWLIWHTPCWLKCAGLTPCEDATQYETSNHSVLIGSSTWCRQIHANLTLNLRRNWIWLVPLLTAAD